ncbi:MAG: pyruvate oxidase [Terrestrivirus sp.]|uniref:Pyruvate oxidase n=1 Tax=Terrestrivirus sp. TaxID=2487775 RepID=A0A3G4ZN83_9VIRU|nr:MAG: pyruvate oxidase [Terrestrivirus sp.]
MDKNIDKYHKSKYINLKHVLIGGSESLNNVSIDYPSLVINKEQPDFSKMQEMTTADIIIDKLITWNVDIVFGIIGDGINPMIEALYKRRHQIRFITVRHEEAGALMASGYAKLTGKIGVCIGTTGPGFLHLLNGLYDASLDNIPVIAISGTINSDLRNTFYSQDINTTHISADFSKFNIMINSPTHALYTMDDVCRSSLSTFSVSHITIPIDIQGQKLHDDNTVLKGKLLGSSTWSSNVLSAKIEDIKMAADILNDGQKIVILIGKGTMHSSNEVLEVAKLLSAPIVKALGARTIIDDESIYTTRGLGYLGTKTSYLAIKECDTLLLLGTSFPYPEYYPELGQAKCVQIDTNCRKIGLRYPATIGLVADIKITLNQLIPLLKRNSNTEFLELTQKKMLDWNKMISMEEASESYPLKPQRVIATIRKYITNDAIISMDTGSNTYFASRHLIFKPGQKLLFSGVLQTMGNGLPFCIASKLAYPNKQCVAIVGDGGFTMLMGEVATAVKYKLPIKVIIIKNNTLEWEMWEQISKGFTPYGYDLEPIDFANVAISCGAEGYTIDKVDQLDTVLSKFFGSNNPAIVQVNVDPNELPIPPEQINI